MLKKIFQLIGISCLFLFSFFYTDKVVTVVKNQDPIMIKIAEFSDNHSLDPVNAVVKDKEIIPGISGCVVDIEQSYNKMKRVGKYNDNNIEYIEVKPKLTITKIYNKYIIKGNKTKNEVAFVFKMTSINYLDDVITLLNNKNIKASFFLDGTAIENNDEVYKIVKKGHELYHFGYNNNYDKDYIIWTNNLIETIANNKANYCLVSTEDEKVLNLCSKNKMYTIKPPIIINSSNQFNLIKDKIEKGSIIMFDVTNSNTINELNNTIVFLSKKDYQYNTLSKHLSEKGC